MTHPHRRRFRGHSHFIEGDWNHVASAVGEGSILVRFAHEYMAPT